MAPTDVNKSSDNIPLRIDPHGNGLNRAWKGGVDVGNNILCLSGRRSYEQSSEEQYSRKQMSIHTGAFQSGQPVTAPGCLLFRGASGSRFTRPCRRCDSRPQFASPATRSSREPLTLRTRTVHPPHIPMTHRRIFTSSRKINPVSGPRHRGTAPS